MRSVRWGVAATVAAVLGVIPGSAQERERREPWRFLLFSGADVWREGAFAHAGLLWSPGGIENEGFTFKLLIGGGSYKYHSGALGGAEVTSRQFLAAAMPGWRIKGERYEVTGFAGLDVQDHRPDPFDPGSDIAGTHAGVRGGFDLWSEPVSGWMVSASASASTVGASYWGRVAAGRWLLDRFWIGPEALTMGDEEYRQFRVGAHLTGFRTGEYEWSAGLGWVTDSDERSGVYARAGVLTRR